MLNFKLPKPKMIDFINDTLRMRLFREEFVPLVEDMRQFVNDAGPAP